MTAKQVLTDSFRFYGRLFNKIFWLSIAYNLAPILLAGTAFGVGQALGNNLIVLLGHIATILSISFFYSYQIRLIHQFSETQNDSLRQALPDAMNRTLPFLGAMFVMGGFVLLISLPLAIVMVGVLDIKDNPDSTSSIIAMSIMFLVMALFVYRLMFVPMYVIVAKTKVLNALSASNQHIKNNKLAFRGVITLLIVMLPYLAIIIISQYMIALSPAATGFLQFALNIIISPFIAIYLYRLFIVSMPPEDVVEKLEDESQADNQSTEDDDHGQNH